MGTYQWIGTGRDSDVNLMALTTWWLERRDYCRATTTGGDEQPEPPPTSAPTAAPAAASSASSAPFASADVPPSSSFTTWTVRPSTEEERVQFQLQERERFSKPTQPFTYRVHGFTAIVGPVKGVGVTQNHRAKAHAMLVMFWLGLTKNTSIVINHNAQNSRFLSVLPSSTCWSLSVTPLPAFRTARGPARRSSNSSGTPSS